jgi:hypothetical protein
MMATPESGKKLQIVKRQGGDLFAQRQSDITRVD